jgi:hypothetical protein
MSWYSPYVALRSHLALTAPIRLLSGYNARIIELPGRKVPSSFTWKTLTPNSV